MMLDDITQAVLAREDVGRYLRGGHGESEYDARERIEAYLDELRTTQRYPIYRALKHPLYPILRKIERLDEHVEIAQSATRTGRVIYISNHKSHLDYLVEPLVLDDNGVRPPVIAAGINLFGGPLGLIHRHVTGAIPIRRNTKDPAYLVTLKAYVSELLNRHDLLFYIEGGRSYSGELKAPKTGLPMRVCRRTAAIRSSFRLRLRTISCSRTASSRIRPRSGAAVRSRVKSPRWCAMPSGISRARS
jgi:glycerol-3-phosphate O-acyltransferase